MRVDPAALDQLLHPTIDPEAERNVIATGLPASPGAASGEIVFSSDEAEALSSQGRKVILVRVETCPEDIHGMHAAEGILTTRGGMTSHAAVVARGMGKPCVSGAGTLRVDYRRADHDRRRCDAEEGRHHHHRRLDRAGARRQGADARAGAGRRIRHADATGPTARAAEGARQRRDAGRCAHRAQIRRRGHRALPHRAHVLRRRPHPGGARDDPRRRRDRRAAPRSPSSCRCSATISSSCSRSWAACRSRSGCSIRRCTSSCRTPTTRSPRSPRRWAPIRESSRDRARELHEFNPMLGFRGCRLAIAYPEIAEMQARAIFEAAIEAGTRHRQAGRAGDHGPADRHARRELDLVKARIDAMARSGRRTRPGARSNIRSAP